MCSQNKVRCSLKHGYFFPSELVPASLYVGCAPGTRRPADDQSLPQNQVDLSLFFGDDLIGPFDPVVRDGPKPCIGRKFPGRVDVAAGRKSDCGD